MFGVPWSRLDTMQYKALFAERPKSFPQVSISKPMVAFVTIGSHSFPINRKGYSILYPLAFVTIGSHSFPINRKGYSILYPLASYVP